MVREGVIENPSHQRPLPKWIKEQPPPIEWLRDSAADHLVYGIRIDELLLELEKSMCDERRFCFETEMNRLPCAMPPYECLWLEGVGQKLGKMAYQLFRRELKDGSGYEVKFITWTSNPMGSASPVSLSGYMVDNQGRYIADSWKFSPPWLSHYTKDGVNDLFDCGGAVIVGHVSAQMICNNTELVILNELKGRKKKKPVGLLASVWRSIVIRPGKHVITGKADRGIDEGEHEDTRWHIVRAHYRRKAGSREVILVKEYGRGNRELGEVVKEFDLKGANARLATC